MSVSFSPCSVSSQEGLDSSFVSQSQDDSLYIPTPVKEFPLRAVQVPNTICLAKLSQVDEFVQQMNKIR